MHPLFTLQPSELRSTAVDDDDNDVGSASSETCSNVYTAHEHAAYPISRAPVLRRCGCGCALKSSGEHLQSVFIKCTQQNFDATRWSPRAMMSTNFRTGAIQLGYSYARRRVDRRATASAQTSIKSLIFTHVNTTRGARRNVRRLGANVDVDVDVDVAGVACARRSCEDKNVACEHASVRACECAKFSTTFLNGLIDYRDGKRASGWAGERRTRQQTFAIRPLPLLGIQRNITSITHITHLYRTVSKQRR